MSDKLGIVYTPIQIIDFILKSADATCRREFGIGLGDEGVRILDPFTGTGAFIARLLQLGLISPSDLGRKYDGELHANEIVLLAYYIAAVNIESAFLEVTGRSAPSPFEGICLADTFAASETSGSMSQVMPDNSNRIKYQNQIDMRVVVGNPPWRAGQGSSADLNPNTAYPRMRHRIEETYALRSRATNKNSLYDTYKMAIRWASDRIGKRGVVGFVTNGSWIDGNADSGIRACLVDEFSAVDVVNLRGNQRTQGERSKQEGGKVFGQGSRAPVAITILTKNPDTTHSGCRIRYREVEDGLSKDEKLSFLEYAGSTGGIEDWKKITPDKHDDWINQRDPSFAKLMPLGSKGAKAKRPGASTIFRLYSSGIFTGRDSNIYNFNKAVCLDNAALAVNCYQTALNEWRQQRDLGERFDECSIALIQRNNRPLRWHAEMVAKLEREIEIEFDESLLNQAHYRPFIPTHAYVEPQLIHRKHRQDQMFPLNGDPNCVICVSGVGATAPFSALATDLLPDRELVSKGQCFPRYSYPSRVEESGEIGFELPTDARIDNITDEALQAFRACMPRTEITKDGIFEYVYGVLHAPDYRERYRNNLSKELPRIPISNNFQYLRRGGGDLIQLHLGFCACPVHPFDVEVAEGSGDLPPNELFRIGAQKMQFMDEAKSSLRVNEFITLHGIPIEAHEYVVNGRTPLEWIIDRYRITTDKKSRIVNDPNGWFKRPEDLIDAIGRAVHVSVETAKIVGGLPPALED